jgi:pimeloyl-ACP methyl ester carboxylesterase
MRGVLKLFGVLFLLLAAAAGVFIVLNQVPDRSVEELKVRWATFPSQFVEISGMQVHLRDEGPPEDPLPILLLHGTGSSLHTWDGWVHTLKDTHRVIRFDMPAFGLTGPSPESNYTIENYARMVVAVMDKCKVNQCVLAGNSLGGYVAWATAVLHPNRVHRLVLVNASGYPYQAKSVPIGFTIARTPVLNRLMGDMLPRAMVENSVKNVYGNPSLVTPELIDRYFDLITRAGNRQALVNRFRQTRPGKLSTRIPDIKIPTLILWGGRDRLIPPHIGHLIHKNIVGSKLIIFDELGHVPQEEDPMNTVSALIKFLAQS